MRLLLTRAVADASRTREKLEAMGHEVIVSPVIEAVSLGAVWPQGVIDAVLATSGQAFSVPIDGLQPEVRRLVPLYLVGSRTDLVARDNGFLGASVVAKNASSLAIMLGKLAQRPQRTLYLAGRDRKPDLETALDITGQRLDVLEVYEARNVGALTAEAARALRAQAIDAILHYSRRSAALLVTMASRHGLDLGRARQFCLSEDVAVPLREAGFDKVTVTTSPNEAGMLGLLDIEQP